MSVDPKDQASAIPFRVYALETIQATQDTAIARIDRVASEASALATAQAVAIERHEAKLGDARDDIIGTKTDIAALAASVVALGEKVATSSNRIAWTFATFALSALGGTIVVVLSQ